MSAPSVVFNSMDPPRIFQGFIEQAHAYAQARENKFSVVDWNQYKQTAADLGLCIIEWHDPSSLNNLKSEEFAQTLGAIFDKYYLSYTANVERGKTASIKPHTICLKGRGATEGATDEAVPAPLLGILGKIV